MSRFDYVKYDEESQNAQGLFKTECEIFESFINDHLPEGRSKDLALTALEECYMWVGKGIRDAQIARNPQTELQEERVDS